MPSPLEQRELISRRVCRSNDFFHCLVIRHRTLLPLFFPSVPKLAHDTQQNLGLAGEDLNFGQHVAQR